MKKLFAVLISLCIVLTVFAACGKNNDNDDHGNEPESESNAVSVITTDEAKISAADAVDYIRGYSAEELSLSDEDYENCSFMVNNSGVQIENDYYVEVIATIKSAHTNEDGSESYTFDNKGEYFIRYDGKQVLKKDMASDETKYDEMELKELPEAESETTEG